MGVDRVCVGGRERTKDSRHNFRGGECRSGAHRVSIVRQVLEHGDREMQLGTRDCRVPLRRRLHPDGVCSDRVSGVWCVPILKFMRIDDTIIALDALWHPGAIPTERWSSGPVPLRRRLHRCLLFWPCSLFHITILMHACDHTHDTHTTILMTILRTHMTLLMKMFHIHTMILMTMPAAYHCAAACRESVLC